MRRIATLTICLAASLGAAAQVAAETLQHGAGAMPPPPPGPYQGAADPMAGPRSGRQRQHADTVSGDYPPPGYDPEKAVRKTSPVAKPAARAKTAQPAVAAPRPQIMPPPAQPNRQAAPAWPRSYPGAVQPRPYPQVPPQRAQALPYRQAGPGGWMYPGPPWQPYRAGPGPWQQQMPGYQMMRPYQYARPPAAPPYWPPYPVAPYGGTPQRPAGAVSARPGAPAMPTVPPARTYPPLRQNPAKSTWVAPPAGPGQLWSSE